MKQTALGALLVIVGITLAGREGGQLLSIDRQGRSIQVDALLIEWNEEDTDTLNGDFFFTADAMNTPAGIAGYIRFQYRDTCPLHALNLFRQAASASALSIRLDTAPAESPWYAVEKVCSEGDTSITAEWLIPWDFVSAGTDGKYEIVAAGLSASGDTVNRFILSGRQEIIKPPRAAFLTPRIIFQAITIVILFVIFSLLKSRAKKLKKR